MIKGTIAITTAYTKKGFSWIGAWMKANDDAMLAKAKKVIDSIPSTREEVVLPAEVKTEASVAVLAPVVVPVEVVKQ